jgi:hypothetical protein
LGLYLGIHVLTLSILTLFSLVGYLFEFRAYSRVWASKVIIASYLSFIPMCSITWLRSLIEIFQHYDWNLSGLLNFDSDLMKILGSDVKHSISCQVFFLDIVGLSLAFVLFIVCRRWKNLLIPLVISFVFSPATVFAYQRILSEQSNIEKILEYQQERIKEKQK